MKPLYNIVETPMFPNKWKLVRVEGGTDNSPSNYFKTIDDAREQMYFRGGELNRIISNEMIERQQELENMLQSDIFVNWMFNHCKIIYYPENMEYPIEHVPGIKDSRRYIEEVIREKLIKGW